MRNSTGNSPLATHNLQLPFIALLAACLPVASVLADDAWPQFRGSRQNGHAEAAGLPLKWSTTQNVVYRTPLPGQGWSSPVVWGEQVWMTAATDGGKSLRALCVDKSGGRLLHEVEVFRVEQPVPKNAVNSHASPTPAIEEGRVYVSFGTTGSACLDTKTGKIIWANQTLKLDHKEGPGSSPILHGGLYILHCDGMDVQYIVALHKDSGTVAWKTTRSRDWATARIVNDFRKAYATPLVREVDGKPQLISVGAKCVYGYEPDTGRELWQCHLPGYSNAQLPVSGHGLVYVNTGYMAAQVWAIRLGGQGDITGSHIAWKHTQPSPLKPSLLLVEDDLYLFADSGIARLLDATTGEKVWQGKLPGSYSASPVYAGGHIYVCSEKGLTTVIKPRTNGREPAVVAENDLGEKIMASPAVVGGSLFIRTDVHLYRIGQ